VKGDGLSAALHAEPETLKNRSQKTPDFKISLSL
jgi:hypothetical protein